MKITKTRKRPDPPRKPKKIMVICVEIGTDNVPFIKLGDHLMRLDLEDLNEKEAQRAEKELQETPENVQFAISKFKEILQAEENLYVPLEDESFLIKFLRPCRFQPETAARILRRFYRFKIKHPKYGKNITPNSVRHVFDTEVFKFLPTRTSSGARIMIVNCGEKWNPKKVSLEDMFKAVMVAIEIAMLEPRTQLGGVHVILDLVGLSLVHVYQFSPSTAKLILDWVQDCTAVRLKGIHVINQPILFNMVYSIFKPFLGDKLKKMLFFHGVNSKSLLENISKESLPEIYGGTADIPDYPGKIFADMLFYYQSDFEVYSTYGYVADTEKARG
ncbi:unnamed protein product [Phaedon cochleariae]|uniref:CRAL-TRIO domain-containing protein n=1 Tax=Phaedon cochleariae TaxID=80249 RepID=A0A9P0DEB2_PHACE|nr:unnamed protein product [Phaedon cochleariae]